MVIIVPKRLQAGSMTHAMKRKGNVLFKNVRMATPLSKENVLSHRAQRANISIAMPTFANPIALKTADFTTMLALNLSLAGKKDDVNTASVLR